MKMLPSRWPLPARLALAVVPAPLLHWLSYEGWDLSRWWPEYFWYSATPMDLLFGLLVLVPYIHAARGAWWRAGLLAAASVLIHWSAIAATTNTQWVLSPLLEWRFASVIPVAMIATLAFAAVTALLAPLRTGRRYWRAALLAGLAGGIGFAIVLTADGDWAEWAWTFGVPWAWWHVCICRALWEGRTAA